MKNTILKMDELSDSREVMESKAPKSISVFVTIVFVIILSLIVWSFFGEIDVYSKVNGEIRPENSTNIVVSESSGNIDSLNYKNGDTVNSGDVLLTINVDSAESQKELLTANIEECEKKISYNKQLKQCIEKDENTFSKQGDEVEYYNQYEKYKSDLNVSLGQIYDSDNQNETSKEEANATLQSLQNSIDKDKDLINEYKTLIETIESGSTFSSSNSMLVSYYNKYVQSLNDADIQIAESELTYTNFKSQSDDGVTQSQIDEAENQLESAKSQKESLKTAAVLELNEKIDSLTSEIESLEETKKKTEASLSGFSSATTEEEVKEQAKLNMVVSIDSTISSLENTKSECELQLVTAQDTIDKSVIKAGISGQIVYYQELSVGNTISSGTQIAKIIPSNNDLKTTLYISSSDISEIKVGQEVEYVVSSISSTDYGKATGVITEISADSFTDETSGTVYYKAVGTLENTSLSNLSGEEKILKSGMVVEGHVISDTKKIIVWFLEQLNFID